MKENSDEIFSLKGDNLLKIPSRDTRTGFRGKSLEDALQTLLEQYPGIIPGSQISPSSEEPPHFALLRREMPVGSWSLDHLYVDQFGVLTLVETKLIQNPESRRDVIGQIIEYAANARDAWGSGQIRNYATEFWHKRGRDLEDVLQEKFPDLDKEEFWRNIEINLRQGRFRLLIGADTIRPEVRRMIEYLNNEMQNVEVLGLELRMYGEDGDNLIFVPRIIGQTQSIMDRKTSPSSLTNWVPELLREAYQKMPAEQGPSLIKVLEWSLETGGFLKSRSQTPSFGIKYRNGNRFLSFYNDGSIYLMITASRYDDDIEIRDRILEELQSLNLFSEDIIAEEVTSGRTSIRKIWELSEKEFEILFEILIKYV